MAKRVDISKIKRVERIAKPVSLKQQIYIDWLNYPELRIVDNEQALCEVLEVSRETLRQWNNDVNFQKIKHLSSEKKMLDNLSLVTNVLMTRVLSNDIYADKARETFFRYVLPELRKKEIAGEYDVLSEQDLLQEVSEQELKEVLGKYSPDDRQRMAQLLAELSELKMRTNISSDVALRSIVLRDIGTYNYFEDQPINNLLGKRVINEEPKSDDVQYKPLQWAKEKTKEESTEEK